MRAKLIAFSMVLLALPWLGWRYVAEMQEFLLQGRAQTQLLAVEGLAGVLGDRPDGFAPGPLPADTPVLYAPRLAEPPLLDGYLGDWGSLPADAARQAGAAPLLRWYAASYRDWLYLLVQVQDPQRVFRHPAITRLDASDQLRLRLEDEHGRRWRVSVGGEGPGRVDATVLAEGWRYPLHDAPRLPLRAYWLETSGGYRLELRLPLARARGLAPGVVDVDDPVERRPEQQQWLPASGRLFRVVAPSPAVQRVIDRFQGQQGRISVVDADRWVLAASRRTSVAEPAPSRLPVSMVGAALQGERRVWREPGRYGLDGRIVAAAPVIAEGRVVGAVVLEQGVDDLLSLQWRSFLRITLESLGALLLVVVGLLLFATRIAWRIRRLGNETARAIDGDGRVRAARIRAESKARDELGELSRRISGMLGRLQRFTGFLEGMPRTLRHEINNPLNVISTSLQNLGDIHPQIADDRYLQAAGRGVERMERIVHSLTEAAGLEQSLRGDPKEPFDLAALAAAYVAGCSEADGSRCVVYRGPANGVWMEGSDLRIEQLLDKLVENARDFTPEGGTITLSLEQTGRDRWLRVSNDGPALPEAIRGQLFDSMVSVREGSDPKRPHLGIGLFIARTIAEFHGGELRAANREDGKGAVFTVRLR